MLASGFGATEKIVGGLKTGPFGKGKQIEDAKFNGAVADISQANFEVAKAIDDKKGDANNGWSISPQMGVPHYAAFSLAKPIGDAQKGVRLRFDLNQPRDRKSTRLNSSHGGISRMPSSA